MSSVTTASHCVHTRVGKIERPYSKLNPQEIINPFIYLLKLSTLYECGLRVAIVCTQFTLASLKYKLWLGSVITWYDSLLLCEANNAQRSAMIM